MEISGWINWGISCVIPGKIAERITEDISWGTSAKNVYVHWRILSKIPNEI